MASPARVRARAAIADLLASGVFDAHGLGDSDAVLAALRKMAAAGTLAPPPKGRRLFTLEPELNPARLALSRARRPTDQAG